MAGRDAEAVSRAVTGLEEYAIIDAGEVDGWLIMEVDRTRVEAPCPACGTFSDRVKSRRQSLVIDAPANGRRCRLVVMKPANSSQVDKRDESLALRPHPTATTGGNRPSATTPS